MTDILGHIAALAIRPPGSARPLPLPVVDAEAGIGLAGDRHADPLSPRQLLLASAGVYRDLALPPQALRENLLLDIDTASLVSGAVLQVGEHALLRLMFQCEACGQLDLAKPGLGRQLGERRGMLARVVRGGVLRTGAPVRALGPVLPAWSSDWRERVVRVLESVPDGAVVDYARLAHLAGVASSYCRAFPRLLSRLGPAYAGKAVAARTPAAAPRWRGDGLFDDEGRL